MAQVQFNKIPQTLKNTALWCCWRYQVRAGEEKATKVPYNPLTGKGAKSNDPSTFARFGQAKMAMDMNGYDGLGIGIFDDLCVIDLDHCVDEMGTFSDLSSEILSLMDTYAEISPGGDGVHLYFRAPGLVYDKEKYYIKNPNNGIEVYVAGATNRFITVTGNALCDAGMNDRTEQLQEVLERYMQREEPKKPKQAVPVQVRLELDEQQIIAKAKAAKNGDKFERLMAGDTSMYRNAKTGKEDESSSDLALCNILAFYTDDPDKIDRIFRSSGLMREKWDRPTAGSTYGRITINEALSTVTQKYGSRTANVEPTKLVPVAPKVVETVGTDLEPLTGEVMLIPGKNGPEKSARNVIRILQQDGNLNEQIYYDRFRNSIRVRESMPWPSEPGPRDWDNADDSMLQNYIEDYIVGLSERSVTNALTEVARNKTIDPLREFLLRLKWDGKPRIATALNEYLGVEQNEYSARVMKHWLVGAVARGLEPGCKFDEMLLLYGDQGAGKSTFISRFCPDVEWFHENLTRIDDKDALQVLRGKWIVCFDELLAQKRSDMREMCKSFLVGRVDTFRPSYGKRFEDHKRRCVFAGSTNERYFLTDRTGNRRYLPVACNKANATKNHLIFDYSPEVTNEFMQMVAEAAEIYKSGEYVLAVYGEFEALQKAELAKYTEEDAREGLISEFLLTTHEDRVCVPMLSVEVLNGPRTPSKREANEIHAIMRLMPGWKQYPKNNGRARCGGYGLQLCYVRDETTRYTPGNGEEVELI